MTADEQAIRAVTGRVFGRPRPYTVTSLGGPTLLWALLDMRGHIAAASQLADAFGPVLAQLEVPDLVELPGALDQFRGRPPDAVTARLRTREVAEALAEGFRSLGWHELVGLLAGWWPDPPLPAEVGELGPWEVAARNELGEALARRVEQYAEVLAVDPAAWDMPPVDVDAGVARLAGALLDPLGQSLVPAASRHPNRVGRLLGAAIVDRMERAVPLRDVCQDAHEVVVEAVCLVAAVAEGITAGPGGAAVRRSLALPGRVVPVVQLGWWPSRWWPVLDAWGAVSSRSRGRVRTVWRLTPAAGDVAVAALLWAVAALGAVAAVGERARTGREWRRRWERELDRTWTPVAGRVWAVVQSVRPASERSPCPFAGGMSRVERGHLWGSAFSQPG